MGLRCCCNSNTSNQYHCLWFPKKVLIGHVRSIEAIAYRTFLSHNTPSSPYSQQPKILHQRLLLMQHHPSIFWYPILLIMGFQMLLMDLAFDQTHLSEDQIQLV